ncbi:MAG: preprotein translocase subunit SecA, partial [Bacteroidota bacterium]
MKNLLKKLFPNKKDRDQKGLIPYVEKINAVYQTYPSLSDDELRAKSHAFRQHLLDYTAEIRGQIDAVKQEAEESTDINAKESLYDKIDALTKEHFEALDTAMEELIPEAFAVVKETARRLTENKQLRVTATDWDREHAEKHDYVEI